jgi:hypothetical protein
MAGQQMGMQWLLLLEAKSCRGLVWVLQVKTRQHVGMQRPLMCPWQVGRKAAAATVYGCGGCRLTGCPWLQQQQQQQQQKAVLRVVAQQPWRNCDLSNVVMACMVN